MTEPADPSAPPDAHWGAGVAPLPPRRIAPARGAALARLRTWTREGGLFGDPGGWDAPAPGAEETARDAEVFALGAVEGVEAALLVARASATDAGPDPAALARVMQAQRRANALRAMLEDAARALHAAGVRAAALKGAAALLAQTPPPAFRGMVDLDLLLAGPDLPRAVAALRAAGWHGDHAAHSPRSDYQYPALFPPGDGAEATLELHVRLGWARGGPLDAEAVLERAAPSTVPGLLIPCAADRAAHLIRHAQLADGRWRSGIARLRDALDWRLIAADPAARDAEAVAALAGWDGTRARHAAEAFLALQSRLWGRGDLVPWDWESRHGDWAARAEARIGDPAARAAARRAARPALARDALLDPALWRHAAAGLTIPARRRRFLARLGIGAAARRPKA